MNIVQVVVIVHTFRILFRPLFGDNISLPGLLPSHWRFYDATYDDTKLGRLTTNLSIN